jgi:hypothetical protein
MKDSLFIYVGPIVRALLVIFGAGGVFDEEQTNQIIGAVTILIVTGQSIYSKHKTKQKIEVAEKKAEVAEAKTEFLEKSKVVVVDSTSK